MSDDWKSGLRLQLEDFIDKLVIDGAQHEDACDAMIEEIGRLRASYNRDPDPVDEETVDEPANEWPAADRPGD